MPFVASASSVAGSVDAVFLVIAGMSVVVLVFITFLMVYFSIKYSRKRHPRGVDIEGNTTLEIIWTVTPLVLFLGMFYFGWTNFSYMRNVPRDAMVITATARQWAWSFTYPNGKRAAELYLALGKPAKIELTSLDVIHGFYVPAFRIKEDVVPGLQNYTWFTPTQPGRFDIECTVICGLNHANMLSKAVVVPVSEFEIWYFGGEDAPLPGGSAVVTQARARLDDPAMEILEGKPCLACHSLDGSAVVGPSFKGLYRRREIVADANGREREVAADVAYLTNSIRDPGAETVKGYPPVMPTTQWTDEDLKRAIALIADLK